jgi:hypothetical protein
MTGFTENEVRLGRMLAKRVNDGYVTPEAAHLTGQRTVGPCVTLQVGDNGIGFYTNATPSLYLGRTFREALGTIQNLASTPHA